MYVHTNKVLNTLQKERFETTIICAFGGDDDYYTMPSGHIIDPFARKACTYITKRLNLKRKKSVF
jgi:hypothetical protein